MGVVVLLRGRFHLLLLLLLLLLLVRLLLVRLLLLLPLHQSNLLGVHRRKIRKTLKPTKSSSRGARVGQGGSR